MGQDELKRALVLEAEARVRALWDEAEAEVAVLRQQVAARRKAAATAAERQMEGEQDLLRAEFRQRCLARRRRECLQAEGRLAERLLALAKAMLPTSVAGRREQWFARLADELPGHAWRQVRVNPEDLPHAAQRFPDAALAAEDGIAGGMIVSADDGRTRIDNSLEKRLERLWPELLPLLFAAIREEVPDDEIMSLIAEL